MTALDRLVADLAAMRLGATFNQYTQWGGDDCGPEAPLIRRENLRRQLRERRDAPVVAVAEAAGWRGARYSGLVLLCERQLAEDGPYRRSSRHPRGWSEPSATIVQSALAAGGWSESVLLWNLVPTHPAGADPHSNRRPTRAELEAGAGVLRRLLDAVRPRHVVAIGRLAQAALGEGVPVVRHPANGGATACRAGLGALLGEWLGAPAVSAGGRS
ncbi:MAG TPA: uracil-DNA glycosylase [Candidatus Dormibacteraeota bacterium]|nr:uracil-DNA glycosylase [Candidatus Dormibacteraeota bacterium]